MPALERLTWNRRYRAYAPTLTLELICSTEEGRWYLSLFTDGRVVLNQYPDTPKGLRAILASFETTEVDLRAWRSTWHRPISTAPYWWLSTQTTYLVQAGDGGPYKIGSASNMRSRLSGLQTGSPLPLRLVATLTGGAPLERLLHRQFAQHRMHGEWFTADPSIPAAFEHLRTDPKAYYRLVQLRWDADSGPPEPRRSAKLNPATRAMLLRASRAQ